MMIAIRLQDQVQALPEPRNKKPRSGYLKAEVLSRAVEDGEARLLARVKKMRGECQQ